MKKYNQAPLPFQGQKRRFLKEFRERLKQFPEQATYVDLFGGSGLLSHTVKEIYPNSKVIWNDYDNYLERLNNVANTNKLLADIRTITAQCEVDKKIPSEVRREILDRIQKEQGFVDYITISGSILFSGKYATSFDDLTKGSFYNRIKKADYAVDGYLQGVERVSMDYRQLHRQYQGQNAIWLLDPPYLSTDSSSYNSDGYWKLSDYLNVLDCLSGNQYFYFTSSKSSIIELCEWISTRTDFINPFNDAWRSSVSGSVNYNSNYEDIMVFK